MTAIRYTYKAYERLKREQHIETLFRTGKAFSVFPLRFIYKAANRNEEPSPVRTGISIPKKKFRKAHQRHRLRRLISEAWRLNKAELYAAMAAGQQLHLFIIYTSTEAVDFNTLQEAVKTGIQKLLAQLTPTDA